MKKYCRTGKYDWA